LHLPGVEDGQLHHGRDAQRRRWHLREQRLDAQPGRNLGPVPLNALCYETINHSPFITPGHDPDLPAQFRAAAAAGFEWIGIDIPSVDADVAAGGSVEQLAELLRECGLRCFELQPLIVTRDADATAREAQHAAALAAAFTTGWVQGGLTDPVDDATAASLRRAAGILRDVDARIALEFLPFTPLRCIADTRALIARAGIDAAIVVDTWHFFHGPDDWDDLEKLALEELAYPQFCDHPALESDDLMQETTQRRVLPGQGTFALERFADAIRAKGYAGPVSVEILSAPLRALPRAEFARRAFESATPYWS
jgi:sugar phosphate isomerase/epimerase